MKEWHEDFSGVLRKKSPCLAVQLWNTNLPAILKFQDSNKHEQLQCTIFDPIQQCPQRTSLTVPVFSVTDL